MMRLENVERREQLAKLAFSRRVAGVVTLSKTTVIHEVGKPRISIKKLD